MARDLNTGMIVSLKKIKKSTLFKLNVQNHILNEIKIQFFLKHINMTKLYGFYFDKNCVYLIQEYASNGNLKQNLQLQLENRFDEDTAIFYIKQILEAVQYLHQNYIIHRDIKLENILISQDIIKISDFGCSVYSPECQRSTFCGTLDYISPEMASGNNYGISIDIWSIGVITFEMLTGKPPFIYSNNEQMLQQIREAKINIPSYISKDAQNFISNILVKEPDERMNLYQLINHQWLNKNTNKSQQNQQITNDIIKLLR
ncbi:protein kinase domain protein [Ichthyophthirius multifiliis]|uniref:Aurora kinase n=1 Tax=Ichthyophthirius multifiliis TaxID=5932 RepID=G0QPD9_ICHMU|nr:protein kinase domain protein [Ichthyophthirius multifiliis]EGR32907.1 protein kinase domain protein [Ichthyophthirius multifiliis]|eukprot:XP_004036893.1 protein kinase domain protein [Ichthyophthirius multifiliis]